MTDLGPLDPRTPVLVGVGQASERVDEAGYRRLSAADLAACAAQEALADSRGDGDDIVAAIDTVAGIRQFANSSPFASAPLGMSDNYPRSVANRIGAAPGRAVLDVVGGQSPQHMVNEFAAAIAQGECEVVLVCGSDAISTQHHLAEAEERPDFTEHVEGGLEDRGYGLAGVVSRQLAWHGLTDAPSQYAMFENARRARLGQSRDEYAASMGALFAPFTEVAAANPHAAARAKRTAEELVTPTTTNRRIVDPYTRYLVARDKVNQGAAVLMMSVAAARRLGVPQRQWAFLHGHADLREPELMRRADLSRGPASIMAAEHALEVAGITVDELATIDLYSCFPIAVFNLCEGLGLSADDPRGLTVTGGLPFFGGPGNNYSMHAIVETVRRLRARRGAYGLVGANGGIQSKYSVGVSSMTPTRWREDRSAELQAEVDSWPAVEQAVRADGWATVETYTVKYRRGGARTGVVIGRLEADDRRFLAMTHDGDEDILHRLSGGEPIGSRVYTRSFGFGNRVTNTKTRMDAMFPSRPRRFRSTYEHVEARRDGNLVEIVIGDVDTSEDPCSPVHDELDEIFDAYFADPSLWVAILTGGGTNFSVGNDRTYSFGAAPNGVPKNGLAGLTSRRSVPKPVIAAVNGAVVGGALEVVLACHLVVADERARFSLGGGRIGVVPAAGGLVRLPRAIPSAVATDMILTGRQLSAYEARDYGVVSRISEPGEAVEGARVAARQILEGSPTAARLSLRVMAETRGIADPVDAVTHSSTAFDELMVSEDTMEGATAFAEGRRPIWRNR